MVEDDQPIAEPLCATLRSHGYDVIWAPTGRAALEAADSEIDVVLLDLGLPDLDGLEVCRRLRDAFPEAQIIIITARRDEIDIVLGLDAGADDYLVKPIRLRELLARVRARLRRQPADDDDSVLAAADVELDLGARRARVGGNEIELRPKEFDLLAALVRDAGRVVSRERLMADVWDEHWYGSTKTLDIHIWALRRKLDAPNESSHISTSRGVGYRFEVP